MDRQPRPRFESTPPAMSAIRVSRFSKMMAASSSAAAEASSQSELSAQQASQSTAGTDSADGADDDKQTSSLATGTAVAVGAGVSAATTSNTIATATDGSGSTITGSAAITSQPSNLSTSRPVTSTAVSDHASDFPYRGPESTGAGFQTSSKAFHAGGPSPGQIAAAVIIPLLFLIALVFAILFLRRRRRRSNAIPPQSQHHHPMADRSGAAFAKEATIPQFNPRHISRPSATAPILTTTTNNTYYTGLSTPTTPSRTTSTNTRGPSDDSTRVAAAGISAYDIPPPAYAKHPPPGSTPTLPQLSFPADPFMDPDPVSPLASTSSSPTISFHTNAALAALSGRDTSYTAVSLSPSSRNGPASARPDISRAGTMRSATSVTSDMYSDTASVHSAKPARMSGAPNVVVGGGSGAGANWLDFGSGSGNGNGNHRMSTGSEYAPGWVVGGGGGDPFKDPR